jgi:exodeoxyribonuclease VII large subunit
MAGPDGERVYGVGEVNRMADACLQDLVLWVEGEVSDFRAYPNYAFFSLREEDAVLPCVIFGDALRDADCEMREGAMVLARGRLGIYVRRGQYRMNVYQLQEAGEGRLRREFFRLLRRLAREGLFDETLKRPLPAYPDRVGLVTSLEGAAVRDVVHNLARRYPCCRLVVRGVRVQGDEAVGDIVAALALFNQACPVDVIILARGGGSLEDLHPFNSEEVVRAIRASSIPVITGVGHEPDLTLADLAADFRASTPTGAAEAAVPSSAEVLSLLRGKELALREGMRRTLHETEKRLLSLEGRRPYLDREVLLGQAYQRLAEAEVALVNQVCAFLGRGSDLLDGHVRALALFPREYRDLPRRIAGGKSQLLSAFRSWYRWKEGEPALRGEELRSRMEALLAAGETRTRLLSSRLHALSPLAVLSRGYAIVTRAGERKPLLSSAEAEIGQLLRVRLHRGGLRCEVREREEPAREGPSPEAE